MSEAKKRKVHGKEFKAKVGLEALRGIKTVNQIGQTHQVHPIQVGQWKKVIVEGAGELFEGKRGPKKVEPEIDRDALYREIGRLKMEVEWLKKSQSYRCRTTHELSTAKTKCRCGGNAH